MDGCFGSSAAGNGRSVSRPRRGHPTLALLIVVVSALVTTATLATGASARAGVASGIPGKAAGDLHSTGVAGTDGTIGHDGRWLTDQGGRVLLLHGVNLVAKGAQSPAQEGFGAQDAAWLVQQGFDVVRLGLTAAAVMPTPGKIDTAYLDSFVSTVNLLTSQACWS
jgi:endoglycosylceramidase